MWEEFHVVMGDDYRIIKISIKDENTVITASVNNLFTCENDSYLEIFYLKLTRKVIIQ